MKVQYRTNAYPSNATSRPTPFLSIPTPRLPFVCLSRIDKQSTFSIMTRLCSLLAFVLLACSSTQAGLTAQDAVLHQKGTTGRKSLGFGPHHSPHRTFTSKEYVHQASTLSHPISKHEIFESALKLAKQVTGAGASTFFVRSDSYMDTTSGLTYVYIKQLINGLQVEDGDLNAVYASDGR